MVVFLTYRLRDKVFQTFSGSISSKVNAEALCRFYTKANVEPIVIPLCLKVMNVMKLLNYRQAN